MATAFLTSVRNESDRDGVSGVRPHAAGVIKSNAQKLIAQGTDWRFLNELKKELKG